MNSDETENIISQCEDLLARLDFDAAAAARTAQVSTFIGTKVWPFIKESRADWVAAYTRLYLDLEKYMSYDYSIEERKLASHPRFQAIEARSKALCEKIFSYDRFLHQRVALFKVALGVEKHDDSQDMECLKDVLKGVLRRYGDMPESSR